MKNMSYAFLFFLILSISAFCSGAIPHVSGNPIYYVVNNTGSCFYLTDVTQEPASGGFCGTNPSCLANLSGTLATGVIQPLIISKPGQYIVLSYSVFLGSGNCDQVRCNPYSNSDCSYYCPSCSGESVGEFSIKIPYEGGIGDDFSFSISEGLLLYVTYNAGTQTYLIDLLIPN